MKSRPDSIDIVLGQDGYSTIVYMTMYIRKKDTGEDVPFPLTCSGQINNGWCAGKATLNMSGIGVDTSSSSNPNLLFAYVCEVVNGAFQCPQYWQIQGAGLPQQ